MKTGIIRALEIKESTFIVSGPHWRFSQETFATSKDNFDSHKWGGDAWN